LRATSSLLHTRLCLFGNFFAAFVASLALVGAATAEVAPIKRLAWMKASAVWTAQAKHAGRGVVCSPYSVSQGTLVCTVFDPKIDPRSSTIVAGEHHQVLGSVLVTRYDRFRTGLGEPHSGCTYEVRSFVGAAKVGGVSRVVDVCAAGWVARLPRLAG
jgi:hypothetical protein